MKYPISIWILIVLLFTTVECIGNEIMHPGAWEIQTATVATHPKTGQKSVTCSTRDYSRSNNSAKWKMSCVAANGKKVISEFQANVSAALTTVSIEQTVGEGSTAVKSNTSVKYFYTGDCTTEMPKM